MISGNGRLMSHAQNFLAGLLVSVVISYFLYRITLPILPFIYQAF